MQRPPKAKGARLCLAIDSRGATLYGNAAALQAIGDWVRWVASTKPENHAECHVLMSSEDDESLFEGRRPRNAWALVDTNLQQLIRPRTESYPGPELTVMIVTDSELDEMAREQESGSLPPGWGGESDGEATS